MRELTIDELTHVYGAGSPSCGSGDRKHGSKSKSKHASRSKKHSKSKSKRHG
ncbi:hypothetical protein [Methylobacterium nodulans]|uniref:Uncharacterized protein n=1 Tax=Methylobacterium nodulans (strain LMG 21967 / CNCM I-2342 / ORS 2060) TaxID=460265 RepID=B8IXA4_METNO|nr:hypothetical protein [Methylobacterium nodulans]ACL63145.1 hypothetical protein Mnod_8166 [Methylobacterium nodulans ORS 2060]